MKVTDFTKFIVRYAGEAASIATVLRTVTQALPLPSQTRGDIGDILDKLDALPSVIGTAAQRIEREPVTIKRADIEAAVSKVLPKLLDEAIARYHVAQEAAEKSSGKVHR